MTALEEAQRGDSWQALVEVRELLEPGMAYLAALCADDEGLSAMRTAVAITDQAMDDADAYIQPTTLFIRPSCTPPETPW